MRYLVFIFCILLFSVPVGAQLYKWVDENGKTQYSDQPPQSNNVRNEQKIKVHAPPAPVSTAGLQDSGSNNGAQTLSEQREEYDERRQERLSQASQRKAEEEENKQKCVDAQSRLRVFLESPRLRIPDGKGGLVYADDNLRQQKIDEANEAIKTFCK